MSGAPPTDAGYPGSLAGAHILLVDDEPSVRLFIAEELRYHGYQVTTLSNGEEALVWLRQNRADLVVLDLKMAGMDGLQVMAELQSLPFPPVMIMLTAHGSLDAAVTAMRRGGCDFLSKPCPPEELLAAIERGLTRRRKQVQREELLELIEQTARQLRATSAARRDIQSPASAPRLLEGRGLLLDRERQMVSRRGEPVILSPLEFRLLACLMSRADEPVSFREMIRETHGVEEPEDTARDALRTTLWRLRARLGQADDARPYIVNVRGRGYMFVKDG